MVAPSRRWSSFRPLVYGVLLVAAASTPPLAWAQVARTEVHSFQSMTLTDQEFLTGRKEAKPVTLAGELRLPYPGNDQLPLVAVISVFLALAYNFIATPLPRVVDGDAGRERNGPGRGA